MANDTDEDEMPGTHSLLNWYDSTRPMFIDLVGDYAGKELFLIEGDSLLRLCFEDERVDFQDGFQLLHATYVVERFLGDLVKRHCQFHIAFLEENSPLCVPSRARDRNHWARYLLARAILKRHLTVHLSDTLNIQVNTFPAFNSTEFSKYLSQHPIHFVMAHDGSTSFGTDSEAEDGVKDVFETHIKSLLRGTIWDFNTNRLNVALINRIEFRDSKVFTEIIESFTRKSSIRLDRTSKFLEEIHAHREAIKTKEVLVAGMNASTISSEQGRLVEAFKDEELNESYCLAIFGISKMLEQKHCDMFMAAAFLFHAVLLKHIPLSHRRLPLIRYEEDVEEQISQFLGDMSGILAGAINNQDWNEIMDDEDFDADAADMIDGRLLRVVIQAMCNGSVHNETLHAAREDWQNVASIVKDLTGYELSTNGNAEVKVRETNGQANSYPPTSEDLAVLPFRNTVFDEHLNCINIKTDSSLPARLAAMKVYRETSHWHNYKKPLITKSIPVQKVSKWKNPLRTNQFYMKEMTNYASSLTGSTGKVLEPETITVGPKQLIKMEDQQDRAKNVKEKKKDPEPMSNTKGPVKKGTKKAAGGLSMKEQIKADNLERRGGNESDKAFSSWSMKMKDFDIIYDNQDRYLRTIEYLNSLDSSKRAFLESDVNTYILQALLNWWADYCKAGKKPGGYHVVALIWTTIRVLCTSKASISEDNFLQMTKICKLLGISDAMVLFKPSMTQRKLSFAFKYPAIQNLQIEGTQTEFQLNHCGPYMDRMLDAKADPRVSSFVPDGWQRDVLDQLDANKSVFVVAPTSAGKTFISFYAMEQVLRADNDGVLVYVAPTKALVNQIAAEVQGRFSKKFQTGGKSVWAIHTRDYRVNNPTGCQILVTVPHILQIMLLSPSNAKSWAPRVKRIIFDEIHSIGQAEDGVVWEQLLLLSPCPIIALSATIGNPDQFNDWLTETQKSLGSDMKMIQHGTRYSDLRKYLYQPPTNFKFSGLTKSEGVGLGLDGLLGFEAFHPVASLVDKSRGIPDDLALEPRDCLILWKEMCRVQTGKYKVPDSLNPDKALPSCIRKVDIFAWEKNLKKVLLAWMHDNDSPFDKVVETLNKGRIPESLPPTPTSDSSVADGLVNPYDLKSTTLPLLYQLHQRRALPAILFNYDRSQCERIAFTLLHQLVDAESKWKEGPAWKKLMEGYQKYTEMKEKKGRAKPAKPSKKSKDDEDDGGSKLDRMRDESSDGASIYDLFDPGAPQDDFTFANSKKLQKSELEEHISALRWKRVPDDLIDLLKRGIGVHHAGMNRKYRQCVEMLFRKGFLRVVIATGTLALGINMPCATVVFSGDSVFLTALNFRQAAGRAGRRGFDLLGNVVFQGISQERVSRLLSSRLPELTGHFPITTTLVLRLFTLLNDSKNSQYAEKAINSLLSQPRLYLGGQSFKEQVLHHLRFSIEYLRRNDLLGPGGEPVNFTSCVSHLYFTENSSFAFHALLKDGYFHKLCEEIDTKTDIVLHEMMLTLSHLFGRRACRKVDDTEEAEKIKHSPSIVYLPPIPETAAEILRKHNKQTLDIFSTYVKTFAAQHISEEERYLPLTHTPVGAAPSNVKTNGHTNDVKNSFDFLPSLPSPQARSAFVALSGLGDEFRTIEDLCSSTREGVFLESAVIPHLELYPDETKTPLNAYLLDFYMHGQLDPLDMANGIRRADVWFLLNDFSMILATIATSLALYLGLDNADPEMLDVMGSGDVAENEEDEKIAATTITETSSTTSNSTRSSTLQPATTKKKIVDDWDASEDAFVAEEEFLREEQNKATGATDEEEYEKLMNVYKAFRKLKVEFDAKFLEIWA